jgi:hypothetical protein
VYVYEWSRGIQQVNRFIDESYLVFVYEWRPMVSSGYWWTAADDPRSHTHLRALLLPSFCHSFLPSFLPIFHRSFMFVPSLVLLVACSTAMCVQRRMIPYSKPNLCVGLLEALVPPKDDDTERAKTLTKKQMKAIDGASIFVSAPTLLLFLEHNDELAEAEKEAA